MKKPSGLNDSESRLWDAFDAFQRIDIKSYARHGHSQFRLVIKSRFRYRLALLRRVAARARKQK